MLFSSLHILHRKRKPLLCGMIKSALRKAIRPDGTRFYTTEQHAVAAVPHGSFLLTAAPPRGFEPPENRGSTVCRQLTFACIHRFISTAIPAASNIRRGEIILLFCGELQSAFLNSLCAINNFIACMIRKVEPEARYRSPHDRLGLSVAHRQFRKHGVKLADSIRLRYDLFFSGGRNDIMVHFNIFHVRGCKRKADGHCFSTAG